MNRTVRRRSVAVQWSLFSRELSVGQMVSLSLLWRGHWLQDKGCSLCFQSAGSKGWLQCQSFPCGFAVYSGLFLAGISWSVRGTTVGEGCLVGEYSLHFCAWNQLSSCFWWAFLLPGNQVWMLAAAYCQLWPADRSLRFHVLLRLQGSSWTIACVYVRKEL